MGIKKALIEFMREEAYRPMVHNCINTLSPMYVS